LKSSNTFDTVENHEEESLMAEWASTDCGPRQVIPIQAVGEEDPLTEAFGAGLENLRDQVRRVACQEATVLLIGNTGTGKTWLARQIHEMSPRRTEPFFVVDCGAMSPSLIESEMFGHVRGAFTGADRDRTGKLAAAGKGTLLLDEINSLPLALQTKLLRAVDERVFEPVGANSSTSLQARLIAASSVPLKQEVACQRFRCDLYFRLSVVEFFLPPLGERRSVIGALAMRLLPGLVERCGSDIQGIAAGAVRALEEYRWPGNIRELRNVLERTIALSSGPTLRLEDLPERIRAVAANGSAGPAGVNGFVANARGTLAQAKEEAEIECIKQALKRHGHNRARAAAALGISRMGLYKKLQKHRLE
jgi:DNA-binding NtrC family response regulator